jgi:hypothetical protein
MWLFKILSTKLTSETNKEAAMTIGSLHMNTEDINFMKTGTT